MYFQIKEIILWPRDQSLKPRRLPFELGKVNVISGASRTGKSAIIPIIDYCLGSGKCAIPVKTIRDSCSWFGVIVQTDAGQKLFARREPGGQKATGDMFVLEGSQINIPDRIENKNINVNAVKQSLDELAGLTNLDFGAEEFNVGFKARTSFRDLAAFTFQPQNLVANPDVLFYKADTYEHREKLRTIFPYVLNAITAQLLAKQQELKQLKNELRRKQRELETIKEVSERWVAEIQAKASAARELGLIKEPISPTATRDQLIEMLSEVVHSSINEVRVTTETISEAVEELVSLQKEESEISLELSGLRRRLAEMSALKESTIQYHDALQVQRDRLKISEWLWKMYDSNHDCPLCGNSLGESTEQLNVLCNSLKNIERTAGEFNTVPAAFDREFERVRSKIKIVTEKLRGIRIRRKALERSSDEAKRYQYDSLKVSRFIGNIEQSLQTYTRIGKDSKLDSEVRELKDRADELKKEISEGHVTNRVNRALDAVCLNAGKLLPYLDSERPNDPISLSITDLMIKVKGVDREDYLWEIGSGSNWLSYHIAVSLGLHQFFLELKQNPVPTFIVYDQPSQVYFPKKLAIREDDTELDLKLIDEDIEAVRKVFKVLSSVVENSNGRLQIIVLDHASESAWGDIQNVNLVEEWRDGRTLVPMDWLKR